MTSLDANILAARPARNPVDPWVPYAFLVEPEHTAGGTAEDVATLFLTNRECPFRCTFCDLWKNTTDTRIPLGAIPAQIDYALSRLPPARHIKLYNSGNFFDPQAIPPEDHTAIVERVRGFRTVIVENHPRLCGRNCIDFQERLDPETRLEVALGLETAHPDVLSRLNKRMTVDDYRGAAIFLREHDIDVRTFLLLRPPYMPRDAALEWAVRSLETAFDAGAQCCSVIATRTGNGTLERLEADGDFVRPKLSELESVLEAGIRLQRGRVFADLWDVEQFADCPACAAARIDRMRTINLTQTLPPPVYCSAALCGVLPAS